MLTIGSLCSGYGGLDLAVEQALGARTAWVSDIDLGARKILAARFPDAPNIGDMAAVDWTAVEPVDVIAGGTPCQDVSSAGKRAGMRAGTRSGLWSAMCDAVATIRPRLVVWENVRGVLSAGADSNVEPCTGCLGDDQGQPHLRALGRVLGDLADLGYDAEWVGLRAADVGACHGRFRVFVVAHAPGDPWWKLVGDGAAPADAGRVLGGQGRVAGPGEAEGRGALGVSGGRDRAEALTLLPTPAVNDMGEGKTPEAWDAWTAAQQAKHGNGNGHGRSLAIEAMRLLPTPTTQPDTGNGHARNLGKEARLLPTPRATDGTKGGPNQRGSSGDLMLPSAVSRLLPTTTVGDAAGSGGNRATGGTHGTTLTDATVRESNRWGEYADAITRHETMLGLPAPAPTETGPRGNPRLAASFAEWMMGLPTGWITDVVSRAEALKAAGNGVVWQQGTEAIRRCALMAEAAAEVAA